MPITGCFHCRLDGEGKKYIVVPSLIMHDGSRVTCTFSASRLAIGLHKRAILITDIRASSDGKHRTSDGRFSRIGLADGKDRSLDEAEAQRVRLARTRLLDVFAPIEGSQVSRISA